MADTKCLDSSPPVQDGLAEFSFQPLLEEMRKRSPSLIFWINGKEHCYDNKTDLDTELTLLEYLRGFCGMTGTKLGCGEGGCGACTVMISRIDEKTHKVSHKAVNSCLLPLCSIQGAALTTVEGIASFKILHPLQQSLAESHGSQCGYCTPGFIMSLHAWLTECRRPGSLSNVMDIEECLDGNLCRCTGYRPILHAIHMLLGSHNDSSLDFQNACKTPTLPPHFEEAAASHPDDTVGEIAKLRRQSDCTFMTMSTRDSERGEDVLNTTKASQPSHSSPLKSWLPASLSTAYLLFIKNRDNWPFLEALHLPLWVNEASEAVKA
ncbi:hypothetical protein IE077_003002, partial [Cardiosporidium cionae]